jgi:hypothetical protein
LLLLLLARLPPTAALLTTLAALLVLLITTLIDIRFTPWTFKKDNAASRIRKQIALRFKP